MLFLFQHKGDSNTSNERIRRKNKKRKKTNRRSVFHSNCDWRFERYKDRCTPLTCKKLLLSSEDCTEKNSTKYSCNKEKKRQADICSLRDSNLKKFCTANRVNSKEKLKCEPKNAVPISSCNIDVYLCRKRKKIVPKVAISKGNCDFISDLCGNDPAFSVECSSKSKKRRIKLKKSKRINAAGIYLSINPCFAQKRKGMNDKNTK